LSTGTYISPHLTSVLERISVCGREITPEEFAEEYGRLLPYFERVDGLQRKVSYFESLTALAYVWFSDKPVSLGVFEVGMGGTWDATNLIRGDVAVLCPVGLDHKELGSTVAEVATEKAGIIKEGKVAVIREQRPEALAVIEARASDMAATLLLEGKDFDLEERSRAVGGQSITVRGLHGRYEGVFIPLFGEQLARNVGAAIVACEALLGRELDDRSLRASLGRMMSPGRLEVVARHPVVVLDGAHNPDAAAALVDAVQDSFTWDRLHLVLGMFADKDVETVAEILADLADRAYACKNSGSRAAPVERVEAALAAAGVDEIETHPTVAQAVEAARDWADEDDLILVTGSFYTVGDARGLFADAST
jgi:dihydrofolate synthase/folylpolyglutamate synthase